MNIQQFQIFESFPEITHFISTRSGGFSSGLYASLNLAFHVSDDKAVVLQNRRKLAEYLSISPDQLYFQQQTHSCNVHQVVENGANKSWKSYEDAVPDNDALMTNLCGKMLCVLVADCVPILLFDPENRAIAAIHSGWKGTVRRIVQRTISEMVDTYGTNPQSLIAAIGPSNGGCCYEVGDDVVNEVHEKLPEFSDLFLKFDDKTKLHFDQWETNKQLLLQMGVMLENIEVFGECTQCNSSTFFSARAAGKNLTGRFAVGIMLV